MKDLKILLVDDQSSILNLLGSILNSLNYKNIKKTTNGKDAIMMHKLQRFDMTFLDVEMEHMCDIQTLIEVKKVNPANYVVMLTGSSTTRVVTECLNAGANGFIAKPFNLKQILKEIEKYGGSSENKSVLESPQ